MIDNQKSSFHGLLASYVICCNCEKEYSTQFKSRQTSFTCLKLSLPINPNITQISVRKKLAEFQKCEIVEDYRCIVCE